MLKNKIQCKCLVLMPYTTCSDALYNLYSRFVRLILMLSILVYKALERLRLGLSILCGRHAYHRQ